MRYVVTRLNPTTGLPTATSHATISDAVDEVMYLDSCGVEGINLMSLPDCPPPALRDWPDDGD